MTVNYSPLSLDGRCAVVVGGTGGIGRALALGLAAAGADVVATSRGAEHVEATAADIEAMGRRSARVVSDVTDRASIEHLAARVIEAFGKVDILVNCAAKTVKVPTLELSEAAWNDVLETNLTGTLRTCQIFGRHMLERHYGRIVNVASLATFVAFHEVTAYTASKAAVGALTRQLAVEWGRHGVVVNAIAPGIFRTALNQDFLDGTARGRELLMRTPMARFGRVEELVGATIFLSSESASFVNGEILTVDGGFLASAVNQ